jgi:multidrug efflux pump subunit AcrB
MAFGAIGAVWGHVLMGLWRDMPLSLISVFGIVALAGVVVNDSLILIDLINQHRTRPTGGRRRGANEAALVREAIVSACVRRFRPVVLTTMTAFLGLLPLLLGAGQQTEVLQPMAVSLAFGVLIGSAITLILVPSLYLIHEDARRLLIPIIGDKAAY